MCFRVPSCVESGVHLTFCAWIECLTGVKANMETVHTTCYWNMVQPYTEKHFKQTEWLLFFISQRIEKN